MTTLTVADILIPNLAL